MCVLHRQVMLNLASVCVEKRRNRYGGFAASHLNFLLPPLTYTEAKGSKIPMSAPAIRAAAPSKRLLAPDLLRGLMLWGIALANVPTAWIMLGGASPSNGPIVNDSLLDKLTLLFTSTFVHARGFPLFSTLLGFGVGVLASSLYRRGYTLPAARKALVRRYGFLALFGAIHLIFIFFGDIMLAYGLIGMLMATMISWQTRTLLWLAGGLFAAANLVVVAGFFLLQSLMGAEATQALMAENSLESLGQVAPATYGQLLLLNLTIFAFILLGFPIQALALLPLMILGMVLAREGVLADPVRFRKPLIWLAVAGSLAAIGTGIPAGLEELGLLDTQIFSLLTRTLGILGGPGFIALMVLLLQGLQAKLDQGASLPSALRPLVALGKRSMTGYVLQSLIFLAVFAPFGLGLFAQAGAFTLFWVASAGWLLTLMICWALDLAGKPGPLEVAHRRLSYGKAGL